MPPCRCQPGEIWKIGGHHDSSSESSNKTQFPQGGLPTLKLSLLKLAIPTDPPNASWNIYVSFYLILFILKTVHFLAKNNAASSASNLCGIWHKCFWLNGGFIHVIIWNMHLLEEIHKFLFTKTMLIATLCIACSVFHIDVFIGIHMRCMSNENIRTVNAGTRFNLPSLYPTGIKGNGFFLGFFQTPPGCTLPTKRTPWRPPPLTAIFGVWITKPITAQDVWQTE